MEIFQRGELIFPFFFLLHLISKHFSFLCLYYLFSVGFLCEIKLNIKVTSEEFQLTAEILSNGNVSKSLQ